MTFLGDNDTPLPELRTNAIQAVESVEMDNDWTKGLPAAEIRRRIGEMIAPIQNEIPAGWSEVEGDPSQAQNPPAPTPPPEPSGELARELARAMNEEDGWAMRRLEEIPDLTRNEASAWAAGLLRMNVRPAIVDQIEDYIDQVHPPPSRAPAPRPPPPQTSRATRRSSCSSPRTARSPSTRPSRRRTFPTRRCSPARRRPTARACS
jgi:hypothetical protein